MAAGGWNGTWHAHHPPTIHSPTRPRRRVTELFQPFGLHYQIRVNGVTSTF